MKNLNSDKYKMRFSVSMVRRCIPRGMFWFMSVFLVIIAGCVSTPEYSSDPLAGIKEVPANPVFSTAKLALIYSENTRKTIEHLQGMSGTKINFFVEKKEDYNPHYVTKAFHRILNNRFKEVIQAESLKEAETHEVDLLLIFDFRFHQGMFSGQKTSVELSGIFMTPNDITIETIRADGYATIPSPYNVSLKPAANSALAQFSQSLDKSKYLIAELKRRAFTTDVTAARPAPPLSTISQLSGTDTPIEVGIRTDRLAVMDIASINFGTYHALVIGNNDYRHFPKLRTAVNDAKAMAVMLQDKYGFELQLLLNATRADILRAISGYRRMLGQRDNLLIYYAGHGWLDKEADAGYWLPIDASPDNEINWVSNSYITSLLRAISAKHILVVADSCYSGKLARGVHIQRRTSDYYARISKKKSRSVLSSGGLEPVADSDGKGGHSVFASAFIDALTENDGIMDGTELFSKVRRPVMLNSDQTPEYSDIRKAGHDGGDFLFFRRKK